MISAPSGWLPTPRCDSRTGAAHLRRGAPCQDASGLWLFRDGGGDPVQVLVVSDGHGGSRYVRSDVGSRLACEVALRTVERTLKASRTGLEGSEAEWRQWLAETLPQAIVEAWLVEVERHWQAQGSALASASGAAPEPAATAAFSPIPYGATLGLLVLTPRWWGHTGLGDWDLVRIEASGEGRLVSEEPEVEGGGEATYSLCMRGAARHFASRSALQPLHPEEPPFTLVLSTDGIRKSCGTDADHLTLAHYLAELPQRDGAAASGDVSELAAALDHISSQGSGDDVSVAIGCWGESGQQQARVQPGGRGEPLIVQPPPPPSAAVSADAVSGRHAAQVAAAQREPLTADVVEAGPSPVGAGSPSRRGSPRKGRRPRGGFPSRSVRTGVGLLALVAGAGLLLAWSQGWGPFAAREPAIPPLTALQRQQLQRQVDQLCGQGGEGTASSGDAATGGSDASSSADRNGGGGEQPQAVRPPEPGPTQMPEPRPTQTVVAGHGPAAVLSESGKAPQGALPLSPQSQAQPPKGHQSQGTGPGGETATQVPAMKAPGPDRAAALAGIRGTLSSRRSIFQRILRDGAPAVQALLRTSAADPLSALIAWSRLQPSLAVELPPVDGSEASGGGPRDGRWSWMPFNASPEGVPVAPQLTLCSALHLGLKEQWTLSRAEWRRSAPGAAGFRPAATGSPAVGPWGTGASPAAPMPAAGGSSGSGLPPTKPRPATTSGISQSSRGQDSSDPNR